MRIIYFILILFVAGCSASPNQSSGELPEDVPSLKTMLSQKKSDLKSLESEIEAIQSKIEALEPSKPPQKVLVTTEVIERQDFEHYSTIQGAIQSDDLLSVSSEMGGRIISLLVDEGQAVKRGQLIATLDMEVVNKQIEEVNTRLSLAKDIYERQARLWEQNIGSEVQYIQAKNNVESLEKNIETLKEQLAKANLYAPISGIVDLVNLKSGEIAGPGTPIVMILNTYNVKAEVDVPENYLGKIRRGQTVQVYFPALDQELTAKVTMLGRKIDPSNRTFKVEINLANRNGLLKPNLLTEVKFRDFVTEDVIIIPRLLVQQEVGGKEFVMVKGQGEEGDVAEKRYLILGDSFEGEAIVEEGLEVGEELIVEGAMMVKEGEPIEIVNATTVNNDGGEN